MWRECVQKIDEEKNLKRLFKGEKNRAVVKEVRSDGLRAMIGSPLDEEAKDSNERNNERWRRSLTLLATLERHLRQHR